MKYQLVHPNAKIKTLLLVLAKVIEAFDKLSQNAAAGPDGIPVILLKKCKCSLSEPLAILFNRMFSSGQVPEVLKTAFRKPIHKGGSRAVPKNFRPVSLTSHLIKTLERIVRSSLVSHLEYHEKLNPNQHDGNQDTGTES